MLLFYLSLVDSPEDKEKFEKLYYEYRELMQHIAYNILKDRALAEDAVHDAFTKIIRYLDGIGEVESHRTKAYVVIIVRSVSLDNLAKEKKHRRFNAEDADKVAISPDPILENIDAAALAGKIEQLFDTYREILILKLYYGSSDKEIADILGITHSAARKRMERARKALEKLLDE